VGGVTTAVANSGTASNVILNLGNVNNQAVVDLRVRVDNNASANAGTGAVPENPIPPEAAVVSGTPMPISENPLAENQERRRSPRHDLPFRHARNRPACGALLQSALARRNRFKPHRRSLCGNGCCSARPVFRNSLSLHP